MRLTTTATPTSLGYYLCVDCGGSKTAVTITDSTGAVRTRINGGPSNFSYLGLNGFLNEVTSCIEVALRTCGVEYRKSLLPAASGESHFAAAWFGVSGVDTPEAVAEITPRLSALLSLPPSPPHFILANDTMLLAAPLVTAARRDPTLRTCVAVVGGTGSTAASFRLTPTANSELGEVPKEIARIGGWGWILGDEGGGFHIGREAIRQLLREHELAVLAGTPLSPPAYDPDTFALRTRVLALFGVKSAPELLVLLHDPDPTEGFDAIPPGGTLPAHRTLEREKRLSQLSPLVFRAAFGDFEGKGGGDRLALRVLKAASDELAGQIALLLEPPSGPSPSIPLAIPAKSSLLVLGGSPLGIPAYRDLLFDALKSRGHEFASFEHVSNAAETGGRVLFELFNTTKQP